ncbi:hypothetical protein RA263_27750, partial [Pseudomonas syringae pv. tagetis]
KSFSNLFSRLRYEGIYVAEDLHWCYWGDYEGGLEDPSCGFQFLLGFCVLLVWLFLYIFCALGGVVFVFFIVGFGFFCDGVGCLCVGAGGLVFGLVGVVGACCLSVGSAVWGALVFFGLADFSCSRALPAMYN